jgi:hypothetical protein
MATDLLILRFVLALASVFLAIWAVLILNIAVDTLCWNCVFFVLNFGHGCLLLYQMRPVKFKNDELEAVYEKMFAPPLTPMTRRDFLELSNLGFFRELNPGSTFVETGNKSHNLSIMISGHMTASNIGNISKQEVVLTEAGPYEFIDSPQWISRGKNPDQTIEVTLRATQYSRFLMWPLESLDELIAKKPMFKYYIDSVVGCDVAMKLFQMDDRIKDTPPDKLSRSLSRGLSNYSAVDNRSSDSEHTVAVSSDANVVPSDNNV